MLQGSYVALVTPFKGNEIDYTAFETLLDFHFHNKTDGILLCGTTGESPALAGDEKERFLRFGLHKCKGRIPVMMGTGFNNIYHTLSLTRKAQEWGVDYALVITPYYNKPSQSGLYHYFKKIALQNDIPIVIYNVPGRTGVNISSETTLKLASEFKNIVGIKEASGDLVQVSRIVRDAPAGFVVMSGEDALNLPILACGGAGAISVTANILPMKVHDLIDYYLKGETDKALSLHNELLRLTEALFIETNPVPVKEALSMMKMIEREVRLPLFYLQDANLETLKQTLINYHLIK